MNQIDLKSRAAIVTGGARGIGHAIATRLLQSGASVALWDRDEAALAAAKAELSAIGPVHTAAVDLTDLAAVQNVAASTAAAFGKIDILVNNAGIAGTNSKTWEADPADWRRVIDINLNGPFYCCHSVIPHMLKGGYGRIVNIASIAGKEGNPNAAHYSASKAAVAAVTRGAALHCRKSGIAVRFPRMLRIRGDKPLHEADTLQTLAFVALAWMDLVVKIPRALMQRRRILNDRVLNDQAMQSLLKKGCSDA